MPCKNGARLRLYILVQHAAIGIIQGLLSLALSQGETRNNDAWIAGLTGGMNFALSLTLLGYFGVHIYSSNLKYKRKRALAAMSFGIVANFVALCATLGENRHEDLLTALTFGSEIKTLTVFAVFFYITLYVTLLMCVACATYSLIELENIPRPAEPEEQRPDEMKEARIFVEPFAKSGSVRRESNFTGETKHPRANTNRIPGGRPNRPWKYDANRRGGGTRRHSDFPSEDGDSCKSHSSRGFSILGDHEIPVHRTPIPKPPPLPHWRNNTHTRERVTCLRTLEEDLKEATARLKSRY